MGTFSADCGPARRRNRLHSFPRGLGWARRNTHTRVANISADRHPGGTLLSGHSSESARNPLRKVSGAAADVTSVRVVTFQSRRELQLEIRAARAYRWNFLC